MNTDLMPPTIDTILPHTILFEGALGHTFKSLIVIRMVG